MKVILIILLLLPSLVGAEVLFEDNFNSQTDWSQVRDGATRSSVYDTGGTDYPAGWSGYYLVRSYLSSPSGRNGIILDSNDAYGGSGKAVSFMDETDGAWDWRGDAILSKFLSTGQAELYIRFRIKFDSDYAWAGVEHSPLRKLIHVHHYIEEPGKFYQNFTSGGNWPATVWSFSKTYSGSGDVNMQHLVRPDPSYTGAQPDGDYGPKWYFDIPADGIDIGNGSGTGTDWDTPGMVGDGQWHIIEVHVKADSSPGADDGVSEFWLDGNLQVSEHSVRYRESGSVMPNALFNSINIGGNSYNPWTGNGGVDDEQGYVMDDFVISTTYVGTDYVIDAPSNITCYPDVDGDLYPGTGSESVTTCTTNWYESSHFTSMASDCDDTDEDINPGLGNCGSVIGGNSSFRNIGTGNSQIRFR